MSEPFSINVICFAGLRDITGTDRVCVTLSPPATIEQLKRQFVSQYPAIETVLPSLLVARNGVYAQDDELISPGDELACFPPVSGG